MHVERRVTGGECCLTWGEGVGGRLCFANTFQFDIYTHFSVAHSYNFSFHSHSHFLQVHLPHSFIHSFLIHLFTLRTKGTVNVFFYLKTCFSSPHPIAPNLALTLKINSTPLPFFFLKKFDLYFLFSCASAKFMRNPKCQF